MASHPGLRVKTGWSLDLRTPLTCGLLVNGMWKSGHRAFVKSSFQKNEPARTAQTTGSYGIIRWHAAVPALDCGAPDAPAASF